MGHASIYGDKRHPYRHIDRCRITVRDNRTITELPKNVVAPTISDTIIGNRTVIKRTRIDKCEPTPFIGQWCFRYGSST